MINAFQELEVNGEGIERFGMVALDVPPAADIAKVQRLLSESPQAQARALAQVASGRRRGLGDPGREESRHGLEDADYRARFMIRDRDGKFPALFDTILTNTGIEVVLSRKRIPRMNSITERWVQTCRHELLVRTLIWNHHHLLRALQEFEQFYNGHRPHQGIANGHPLHPLPPPITDPGQIARLDIRKRDRLGGILHECQHSA
ncbi:integrase core domain-containing protein [Streptomyces mirabilis]|uniref:integrase core domain-containing protein n=1 Tax=Streptomyces mirabilis TaxID=68239 RepID=UPI0033292485